MTKTLCMNLSVLKAWHALSKWAQVQTKTTKTIYSGVSQPICIQYWRLGHMIMWVKGCYFFILSSRVQESSNQQSILLLPFTAEPQKAMGFSHSYRPFSYCIDQARLGAFTAKSGCKHYNPPPLTVMFCYSLCSLSAIILFQTCSNKCILYVLLFHKYIKIKYKTVNMYGVFLWLVQSSSRWNTIHSHRNYHVQLLSVWVGEFCHPARSR